ncbi:formyltetrahydrofolate deformylase 1, mitochondrial isoform X1 [Citrus sinensis]|uniref:formyltetrahydrofolate deformylase 1, mitochondrial isoform X1 n=1 Tax=Citrus sinensis TaxID=2711 RepID=UPI00227868F9|nr:formyltetrahydrofolate deformylase 1, mitochondrial isoform X1 [Citrus sinensis]
MTLLRRLSSSLQQVVKFTNRSFKSLKFPGEPIESSVSSTLTHGIHVFHCPVSPPPTQTHSHISDWSLFDCSETAGSKKNDEVGIVAKLSECIASRGGNILAADVFVPEKKNVFYSRSEFIFDPIKWPREQMDEDFFKLSKMFNAMRSVVRVPDIDPKYKVAVLASKQEHCLVDFLYGWQEGKLPVEITCVISNHDRGPNSHVIRLLERHGIPYHYLCAKENKREEELLELVQNTDFLVLARYMQPVPLQKEAYLGYKLLESLSSKGSLTSYFNMILSGKFLRSYGKDVINIHHGLLPSFKGGKPAKQAFDAGVKLIGATSHFVTEELDAGPIIEQMVERVSHRDNLRTFVQKSEDVEKQCLAKAIKSYCELRVLPYEMNKTVVF